MITLREKILVTLPDSIAAVDGVVTMVHPDGETVSALVDGKVRGVVFAESGQARQGIARRGIPHATYRKLPWPTLVALKKLYHDVVRVMGGGV